MTEKSQLEEGVSETDEAKPRVLVPLAVGRNRADRMRLIASMRSGDSPTHLSAQEKFKRKKRRKQAKLSRRRNRR